MIVFVKCSYNDPLVIFTNLYRNPYVHHVYLRKSITSIVMKKRIIATAYLLAILALPLFAVAATSYAANECNGVATSIDLGCSKGDADSISSIILYVISFMAIGVGVAVVIGIVFGGITYIMSDGDTGEAKKGRDIIANSIIGLFLFIFLYAGANFLIPGGAFNALGKSATTASSMFSSGGSSGNSSSGSSSGGSSGSSSGGSSSGGSTSQATTIPSFSSIANFRDAGGTGGIKTGILFRSGRLYSASASDITKLSTLLDGGTIIDLRESSKVSQFPDKNIPNTTTVRYPMTSTTSLSTFVTKSSDRNSVASAIKTVANSNGRILIHCTAGRDRTGWTVAMILHIAGATDDQIINDFKKSSGGISAPPASRLEAGLKQATTSYGSLDKYITDGLGIDTATINKIRAKLKV